MYRVQRVHRLYSHLLVSFGSLIVWVSCLDGDDGRGISVEFERNNMNNCGISLGIRKQPLSEKRNTHRKIPNSGEEQKKQQTMEPIKYVQICLKCTFCSLFIFLNVRSFMIYVQYMHFAYLYFTDSRTYQIISNDEKIKTNKSCSKSIGKCKYSSVSKQ